VKVTVVSESGRVVVALDSNTADLSRLLGDCGLTDGSAQMGYHLAVRLTTTEVFQLMEAWARRLIDPDDGRAHIDLAQHVAEIREAHKIQTLPEAP